MNVFENSNSNKRYYTLDYYYKSIFNDKVFKVSLNQGFTCPNIDGVKGYGGCIFCKNGSGEYGGNQYKSIREQFNDVKNMSLKKWPHAKYIAYFQSNSNTYGDLNTIKKNCEEVLTYDDVVGISIATRCDTISDECLNYLDDLNKRTFLTIELGLQSISKETSLLINRGHTLDEFKDMVKKLKNLNIKVVVHIINGLPYETKEMMLDTVKYLNKLNINGIKIHMLHIINDTKIANMYLNKPFHILTKEEYIDIVVSQLELLNKSIVIHRITGDPNKDELIKPAWLIKKFCVLNDIDKEQKKEIHIKENLFPDESFLFYQRSPSCISVNTTS